MLANLDHIFKKEPNYHVGNPFRCNRIAQQLIVMLGELEGRIPNFWGPHLACRPHLIPLVKSI